MPTDRKTRPGQFYHSPEPDWDAPPEPSTEDPGEIIAITGSRRFPDPALAERYLRSWMKKLPIDTVIRTGGATGIDQLATRLAGDAGLKTEVIPPDYQAYPSGLRWQAPLDRNTIIVQGGELHGRVWPPADKVLALWDGVSNGTRDTIDKARTAGIRVAVIGPDGKKA